MKYRFEITACTKTRTKSFDAIRMTTLLELVVFLAPPLRPDADRPCALRLAGAVSTVELMCLSILAQQVAHTFWVVLSNILFICRGNGGYYAVMRTLPQVYGGVWIGKHCLSCIAGGVNCSNHHVWLTNFVQNREGNCATFYRLMRASLWFVAWTRMKKAFGFPKAFALTMVETRGIEPLTS